MSTALVSRSATFTVNTTDDDVDVAPGDGICTTAGGTCMLRAAIQETNYLRRAAAAPLLTPSQGCMKKHSRTKHGQSTDSTFGEAAGHEAGAPLSPEDATNATPARLK